MDELLHFADRVALEAALPLKLILTGLKATVLLIFAGILTLLLRRGSAAARHLIWTTAVAAVLALPLLSLGVPGWHLPLADHLPSGIVAPVPRVIEPPEPALAPTPWAAPLPPVARRDLPSSVAPLAPPAPVDPEPLQLGELPASPEPVGPQTESRILTVLLGLLSELPRLLVVTWAAGVALMLGRLAAGLFGVWRLARRSRPVRDLRWSRLLGELRAELGIRRPVRLLVSDAASMPMTWGILRPTVVLPPDAAAWDAERRRVVLLHELVHVERLDCLTQRLGQLACAFYWPHPFVWLAAWRLRAERELACDDRVLRSGTRASAYARHLVEVARAFRSPGMANAAALAMARPSQLETRVLAILDEERDRRTTSRRFATVLTLLTLGLCLPLAALRPALSAQVPGPELQPPPELPDPEVWAEEIDPFHEHDVDYDPFDHDVDFDFDYDFDNDFDFDYDVEYDPDFGHELDLDVEVEFDYDQPGDYTVEAGPTPAPQPHASPRPQTGARSGRSGSALALRSRPGAPLERVVERQFRARSGQTLRLVLRTGGSVRIVGWDSNDVFVRTELGGRRWRDNRVAVEQTSDGVSIVSWSEQGTGRADAAHRFEVQVPRRFNVEIASTGGDVEIAGVRGRFSGTTHAGEVVLAGLEGRSQLVTLHGGVTVSASRLDGEVQAHGGEVVMHAVGGGLRGYADGHQVVPSRPADAETIVRAGLPESWRTVEHVARADLEMDAAQLEDIAFADPDAKMQRRAVASLADLPAMRGHAALTRIAQAHPSHAVRLLAIEHLARSGCGESVQALGEVLAAPAEARVARAAVAALAESYRAEHDAETRSAIRAVLRHTARTHPDARTREAAATALGGVAVRAPAPPRQAPPPAEPAAAEDVLQAAVQAGLRAIAESPAVDRLNSAAVEVGLAAAEAAITTGLEHLKDERARRELADWLGGTVRAVLEDAAASSRPAPAARASGAG